MGTAMNNTQLNRLVRRHRELDRELSYLVRRAYLTPAEQLRAAELKKLKLSTKDRIAQINAS